MDNVIETSEYDWCERAHPRYERISGYLKRGVPVADSIFDKIYPLDVAKNSEMHWTPVKVATVAAKLLCNGTDRRILDVGSGCGKFCLVGSLTTPGHFVGVERRKYLAEIAKESAARLGSSAQFTHDDAFSVDWQSFDAFYFFNPFYEMKEPELRIDKSLEGNRELDFVNLTTATTNRLSRLRAQTRVVTYHGFGGEMPPSYELDKRVSAGSSFLNLWVKRA